MVHKVQDEVKQRMEKSLEAFNLEASRLRTGRASLALVDGVRVDYYGSQTPLNQMATLGVPDARTITIQPWDMSAVPMIEKALLASELGISPVNDGKLIRLTMPPLNEERRKDLVKVLKKHAEECRVSVRNARRIANEELKKQLKEGQLTEDEERKAQDAVQKLTDDFNKKIDAAVVIKEKDIMEV